MNGVIKVTTGPQRTNFAAGLRPEKASLELPEFICNVTGTTLDPGESDNRAILRLRSNHRRKHDRTV